MKLVNNPKAWETIRKSAPVKNEILARAERAREAADRWMGAPGSFKVVTEPGARRTRYTVRPATYAALRRVAKDPAGFANVCINAGR